jgi:hypothetical protein
MARQTFRILLVKPSKYAIDGYVERFRKGFMPNATLLHLKSMTPEALGGRPIVVDAIDEYTQSNPQVSEPTGALRRSCEPVSSAWHLNSLLEHPRFPGAG